MRAGSDATLVVGRGSFQAVMLSFSPSRRVAVHGFGHFFARIFANASALSLPCVRDVTICPVFHALCFLMTSLSTALKAIVGTGFAANISSLDASLSARRSS